MCRYPADESPLLGVTSPLVVDFGSELDGFDVVGFEFHAASKYLAPMLESLTCDRIQQD